MTRTGADGGDPVHLDFLLYLRERGFHVGVEEYARALKVVDEYARAPRPARVDDAAPELETLLCPVFAKNPKQQEQFHELFERYFEDLRARRGGSPPAPPPPPAPPIKPRFGPLAALGAALALLVAATAIALWKFPSRVKPENLNGNANANLNSNLNSNANPDANKNQNSNVESNGNTSQTNTNSHTNKNEHGSNKNEGQNANVRPAPTATALAGPLASATSAPTLSPTPSPSPSPTTTPPPPSYYYLLAVALPLLLYLLVEAFVYFRRKLVLGRHPPRKPPAVWPLRVESAPPRLYDAEEFRDAARMMRRRQVGEYQRLDIGATVRATVAALGYPDFRYRPDSKVPEYLALIERASFRDHQARLFGELTRALEREGLFVTRLFYDEDPRVCCDEGGAACVTLAEMQSRYAGWRLLVFGDGERLLDPETGRLAAWAEMFSEWQERALLTPDAHWGLRETVLSDLFTVVPATTEGLAALAARFESILTTNLPLWPRGDGAEVLPPWVDEEGLVSALRVRLGARVFRWLCACAVYPELHWGLTLRLGSLPATGEGLVCEENLLRLARLPWFRAGALPDELRWRLVELLGEEDAAALREARAAIIGLLEAERPPEGSFASDRHALELAVQRWLHDGDEQSLSRLREVLRRVPPAQILRDRTLVRYLERMPNRLLDLLLPRRLRKLFFRDGLPWLGTRSLGRLLLALMAVIIALLTVYSGVIHSPTPTRPTPTPTPTPSASPSPSPTAPVVIPTESPTASPSPTVSPTALPGTATLELEILYGGSRRGDTVNISLQPEGGGQGINLPGELDTSDIISIPGLRQNAYTVVAVSKNFHMTGVAKVDLRGKSVVRQTVEMRSTAPPLQAGSPTPPIETPPGQLTVTGATVRAEPPTYSGPCPATVRLVGEFTAQGRGTVEYRFVINGGVPSVTMPQMMVGPTRRLTFNGPGTQQAYEDETFKSPFKGEAEIEVLSPQSAPAVGVVASFEVRCVGQGVQLTSLDVTFATTGGKKSKGEPISLSVWANDPDRRDERVVGNANAGDGQEWARGSSHRVHINLFRPVPVGQCGSLRLSVTKGQVIGGLIFEGQPDADPGGVPSFILASAQNSNASPTSSGPRRRRGRRPRQPSQEWDATVVVRGNLSDGTARPLISSSDASIKLGGEAEDFVDIPLHCPQ